MRGFIYLGDYATSHPDNTASVMRGGIAAVVAPKGEPVAFLGGILIRVKGPPGEHKLRLDLRTPEGVKAVPDAAGVSLPLELKIVIPKVAFGEGAAQIVGPMRLVLPAHGVYTFELRVDDEVLDTWPLTLSEPPDSNPTPAPKET